MKNNIAKIEENIIKAKAFLATYGEALAKAEHTYLSVSDYRVSVSSQRDDLPLLGEVFTKSGWTRKLPGYSSTPKFDWVKTVDGVPITVSDAEDCDLNDSPVPEKAFPILLN